MSSAASQTSKNNMLDPVIVELLPDPTKRTNILVEIDTPTPRRWTLYPGGLTWNGTHYTSADVSVAGVVEALDQSQPLAASITIVGIALAGDLVRDATNRRKPVRIKRLWFDAAWQPVGTDTWFEGVTGKPSFRGARVSIECVQTVGRRGSSPTRSYAELMHSHRPPDNLSITL
jgi:hypothetical protein